MRVLFFFRQSPAPLRRMPRSTRSSARLIRSGFAGLRARRHARRRDLLARLRHGRSRSRPISPTTSSTPSRLDLQAAHRRFHPPARRGRQALDRRRHSQVHPRTPELARRSLSPPPHPHQRHASISGPCSAWIRWRLNLRPDHRSGRARHSHQTEGAQLPARRTVSLLQPRASPVASPSSASAESCSASSRRSAFGPLGMTHTFFRDNHAEIVKNQAYGYLRAGAGRFELRIPNFDTTGATSLLTIAGEDFAKCGTRMSITRKPRWPRSPRWRARSPQQRRCHRLRGLRLQPGVYSVLRRDRCWRRRRRLQGRLHALPQGAPGHRLPLQPRPVDSARSQQTGRRRLPRR